MLKDRKNSCVYLTLMFMCWAMKAVVYEGPNTVSVKDVPDAKTEESGMC